MRGDPKRVLDFKGGVNLRDANYLLDSNYARDALNVTTNPQGAVIKRYGWQNFSTPAFELHSLYAEEATATDVMIGVADNGATGKIYSISTTGTATDITGGTAISRTDPWEWVQAPASGGQGPIYGMNGVSIPKYWTGAGNTADWTAASGTLPNGKYVVSWGNRLWVAGMSAYGAVADPGSTVVYSDIGNPRAWSAANVTALDPNDGDYITGLGVCGPYLLVYKRNKIYAIYDSDTSANRRISTGVGCLSHRTIVESPPPTDDEDNDANAKRTTLSTFFLSQDGVFITNGQSVQPVSDKVGPLLDQIPAAAISKPCAMIANGRYFLSFPTTGTTNNYTIEYILATGAWWIHDCKANQYAVWSTTGKRVPYAANTGSAKISTAFVSGVYQDNAANYTSYWTSAWLTWRAPYLRKRVRQLHMEGSGNVDLYYARDFAAATALFKEDVFNSAQSTTTFGGTGTFEGTGLYGDGGAITEGRAYTMGVARAWCFEFRLPSTDPSASSAWRLDGFTPMITPRKN